METPCITAYHTGMGTPTFSYVTELGEALHRRGDPMSPQDFLSVLQEVGGSQGEALSAGERDFLLRYTDVAEIDLTDEARAASRMTAIKGRIATDTAVESDALTTREVAQLLGRAPANVRRSRLSGDLYSPGTGITGSSLRFPAWQFTQDGHIVPGLREIIPMFPRSYHPLSIERFMTFPNESLDNLSPVQWLLQGGARGTVVRLIDELGYE